MCAHRGGGERAPPASWRASTPHTLHRADQLVLWLTRGRTSVAALLSGLPVIMLTTIGSNWGRRRHPSWYHNLRARSQAAITRDGETIAMTARQLDGEERERCLALAIEMYPGYAAYRRRAAHRELSVFRLVPVD
jgi:deazaflavin-dependent oxidoreductase (nitroreductase family)